jgi:nucleotide-binding universal stress UspA family protein
MRALVAFDGSPSAGVALDLVASIRWPIGTAVRLVSVVDTGNDLVGGPWPSLAVVEGADVETQLVTAAMQDLHDAAAQLSAIGMRTDTSVVRGRPADELTGDVIAHRPDVVFVGSRGHSAIDRMLLGSVSAELVDRSPVPVLVARRPSIERVVIAVDGSSIAAEAVNAVRYQPFLAAAEIVVLSVAPTGLRAGLMPRLTEPHVVDVDHDGHVGAVDVYRRYATESADQLCEIGLNARAEVRAGNAAHEVVAFAERWDADLIITGSHGRTGVRRLILGSVARNVLHHATCSVLIVKRHAEVVAAGEPSLVASAWTIGAAR